MSVLPGSGLDTSKFYRVERGSLHWDGRRPVFEISCDERDNSWWVVVIDPFHPRAMPNVFHSDDQWAEMNSRMEPIKLEPGEAEPFFNAIETRNEPLSVDNLEERVAQMVELFQSMQPTPEQILANIREAMKDD